MYFSPFKTRLVSFLLFLACMALTLPAFADERAVKDGDNVSIHYTGKLQDQTVFDSSEGRGPLKFKAGTKEIIPGMNNAVIGMKVGESKTVTIPPEEAYGPVNEKLVFEIGKDKLPPDVTVGAALMNPQGHRVVVKEINGDKAVLDANHMLAGKSLIFEIKLISIE